MDQIYWIKQGLWWDLLESSNKAGAKIIGKRADMLQECEVERSNEW